MGVLRFDICMRKAKGRRYHNGCPSKQIDLRKC
nr:MAG TPA: hypothetical protein [Caudoviricetes sp.]